MGVNSPRDLNITGHYSTQGHPFLFATDYLSPKEKYAWKAYAKKLGIPLASFIKKEINNIVFGEPYDYNQIVDPLLNFNPEVLAVCFVDVKDNGKVLFSTRNFGPTGDCQKVVHQWISESTSDVPIFLQGEKYILQQRSPERLIAKNIPQNQYLVGVRQGIDDTYFLAKVQGNAMTAWVDLARVAQKASSQESDTSDIKFGTTKGQLFIPEIDGLQQQNWIETRKKIQEERQQELQIVKDKWVEGILNEILEYQVRNHVNEITGMAKNDLYDFLAKTSDVAKFEVDKILEKNHRYVIHPTETTIFLKKER